jgi:TP901 family phage tail tape measure protein
LADNELSVNIGVNLEIDEKTAIKQLEGVAKKLGMTGEGLLKDLNIEIDVVNIDAVEEKLWSIINLTEGVGNSLKDIFKADPSAQTRMFSEVRKQLNLIEREATTKIGKAKGKTGKLKNLEDAISVELFGEKGVKFNVGSFKGKIDSKVKTWIEDFGDDAVNSIDLVDASLEDVTTELNDYAKNIAKGVGVAFKNADETAIDFLDLADPKDAETLVSALEKLQNGMQLSAKELLSVQNFNLNENGKFTVSPAMFIDAYEKAVLKHGANLIGDNPVKLKGGKNELEKLQTDYQSRVDELDKLLAVKGTEWFDQKLYNQISEEVDAIREKISKALLPKNSDMEFGSLYDTVGQANEKVVAFFEQTIQSISKKPQGDAKISAKFGAIEDKIIGEILEKARATGERALKEKGNGFNRKMLDVYAPAADIKDAAGGSEDTVNLLRYAQEKAARKVRELEMAYGLAEGTVASYLKVISQEGGNLNKIFSEQEAAIAILTTSFADVDGNVSSAVASGKFLNVKSIFEQVAENPALLENLIGVKDDAMQKKIEKLVAQKAKELGRELNADELQQAYYVALVQSLEGQIARAPISQLDEAKMLADQMLKKVAAARYKQQDIDKSLKEFEKAQLAYVKAIASGGEDSPEAAATRVAVDRAEAGVLKARIAADAVNYEIQDIQRRQALLMGGPAAGADASDAKRKNAEKVMAARDAAEEELRKQYGQELARNIAIAREAGTKLEFSYEEYRKVIAKRADEMLAQPEAAATGDLEKTGFVGGSRSLKEIPDAAKELLQKWMAEQRKIVIGDAPGIDTAFQEFLKNAGYSNVTIHYAGNAPRNNVGSWDSQRTSGGHTAKDETMTSLADEMLMVWDQKSAGTIKNIERGITAGVTGILMGSSGQLLSGGAPAQPAAMPAIEEAPKKNYFDKVRELILEQRDAYEQLGSTLVAALDTEYNPALEQFVTELNLKIKTVDGKFVDLLNFIHIPTDAQKLALDKSPSGAKSVEALQERAQQLGIDPTKLGSLDNQETNKTELYAKVKALVELVNILDEAGVGLTGSNFATAEGANIRKMIEHVNKVSGMPPLAIPEAFTKGSNAPWDSVKEFGLAGARSNEIKRVTEQGAGLGSIMAGISKHFPEFLEQFKDFLVMTENGPVTFGSKNPKTGERFQLPAHYAANDTIQSLIVRAFYEEYAHVTDRIASFNRANVEKNKVRNTPSKPDAAGGNAGGGNGGGAGTPSGPSGDDPMANRASASLVRWFHTSSEYVRMLSGLTTEERELTSIRLKALEKDRKRVADSARMTELESSAKSQIGMSRSQIAQTQPGFIGPIAKDADIAKRKVDALLLANREYQDLIKKNRGVEQETINKAFLERKEKEALVLTTRKQLDQQFELKQAGKDFTTQVKINAREQIEAQKAVQKANAQQINQWVTARYALYDVGNFYQNLSQQMFRLTRQIFDTTATYRSFQTAFTSVERAMQISGDAAIDMRDQFIRLSETLPVTFEDLSRIATLGAQMGIGAGGITDFTETVAKFSAITSISADTVAQKFGRIAELADIDSSQFTNLGSAVSFAGVNAVATDTEILNLSESIAAVSNQAGFAPGEIIGMSTALASVGIQAEQARGVFTRVFADIDRVVSKGGSGLDAFAKASGMSAEDFAKQWNTDGESYGVFRRLLGGLGSASDATAIFDALNIVETREINTLTRLAQNLNVVDQAVSDSNQSFADGTFLATSFGKTADNLDSQLTIFKNNLDSFAASFSQVFAGQLATALENGSKFLEFLKGASGSPIAQFLLPAVATITAIGGAAAIATAGVTKLVAQVYAFRVAQIQQMNNSSDATLGTINRIKQLTGAYSGLIEMRAGLANTMDPQNQRGVVTPVTYSTAGIFAAQAKGVASLNPKTYLRTVELAKQAELLKTQNVYLVSANGLSKQAVANARLQADAVQKFIDARKEAIDSTVDRMTPFGDPKDTAGLDATQAKRQVLKQEMMARQVLVSVVGTEVTAVSRSEVAKLRETIANEGLHKSIRKAAQARLDSIVAVNMETTTATSASKKLLNSVASASMAAVSWAGAIFGVVSMVGMLAAAIEDANKVKLLESGGGLQSLREAIAKDTAEWKKSGDAISTVAVEYVDYEAEVYDAYDAIVAVTGANENLKQTTGQVTENIKTQTAAIGENTKEWILNSIIGNEKVNQWLKDNPGLFNEAEASLKEYGYSFKELIQSVLKNPTSGGKDAISKIDEAITGLQSKTLLLPITPDQLLNNLILQEKISNLDKIKTLIREIADATKLGLDTSALEKSLRGAIDTTEKLDTGIKDLTASVKTLTQWSGEVGQVMQAAFDIRYGKITALDNIRKAWSDLRKKADEGRKALEKANNTINGLKANRQVLQYQFDIAIKYGDSKRAAELQAKLDENTTNTADANKELSDAQASLSTDLRTGSDAAIENRQTLSNLVQTYIPYIQALLNSGKKQKDVAIEVDKLKSEFSKQAQEIGFAESDLNGYLGTFDLYKKTVTEMPNTVTVNIKGLDEAARAMKEFAAAVNGMSDKPIVDKASLAALKEAAKRQEAITKYKSLAFETSLLEKRISAGAMSVRAIDVLSTSLSKLRAEMRDLDKTYSILGPYGGGYLEAAMKSNGFATGGYISGPGTGTSDSIPARLSNGEFVMSAKTVSTYGVDFMNALNQSRVMYSPAQPSMAQAGGGSSVVYLSPDDRALLRAAIDRPVNLYADSTRLAQSVNNGNKVLAQRGVI